MTNEQIELIKKTWQESDVQMHWNLWLGYTLKQKFEKLISAVVFMANSGQVDDDDHLFVNLYATPEVTSVFETAVKGFEPISSEEWELNKNSKIQKVGVISYKESKFNLFKDVDASQAEVLATIENNRYGLRLKIDNFII